jgi:hypothetical protein
VGGVVGGGVFRVFVAEAHPIDAGEQVLAPAQKHEGDHEVDLVDQPGSTVPAAQRTRSHISRVGEQGRAGPGGNQGVFARLQRAEASFAQLKNSFERTVESSIMLSLRVSFDG